MITPEQSAQLKEYFPVKSHEFLQGKTYISEEAITNRLDEVDPSWTFERLDMAVRDTQVIATFRLTVCGVSRDGVGMDSIKQGAGEAEKSAATDALKRAARLFGIGRYILEMGKAVTDYQSLERWLIQRRGVDTSTGEIQIVDKAAGDYEPRTPKAALNGNGQQERRIPPQSRQDASNSSADANEGSGQPDTREWTANAVIVRKDKFGKPYLQYVCNEGKPTGRGRDQLRQAGYECEAWTVEGETYDLTPAALVTVQKNGQFWNVMSLKPVQSEVAF